MDYYKARGKEKGEEDSVEEVRGLVYSNDCVAARVPRARGKCTVVPTEAPPLFWSSWTASTTRCSRVPRYPLSIFRYPAPRHPGETATEGERLATPPDQVALLLIGPLEHSRLPPT